MGLLEGHANYKLEECQKYLEALDYINGLNNLGVGIKDNESELRYYVPYIRCLSYLN